VKQLQLDALVVRKIRDIIVLEHLLKLALEYVGMDEECLLRDVMTE